MKITAINGSSKSDGISSLIIKQMENLLDVDINTHHAIKVFRSETVEKSIDDILESDILLIGFPLYIDSLPFPLIDLLTKLEKALQHRASAMRVYTIVNGALDAEQTELAIEMISHFAYRSGLLWGYGIGIGEGSMLYNVGDNWEQGPASEIHDALSKMSIAIQKRQCEENRYLAPKFPRFLYKFAANIIFLISAKRNKVHNTRAQPYMHD